MQLLQAPFYHFLLIPEDFIPKHQSPEQQLNLLYKLDYLTKSRINYTNRAFERLNHIYSLRLYTAITQFLREMTLHSLNSTKWIEGQISKKAHLNFLFVVFKSNQLAHFKRSFINDCNKSNILIPPNLLKRVQTANSMEDALKYSRRYHAAIAHKHENEFKIFPRYL